MKKTLKLVLIALLILLVTFTVAGCGNKEEKTESKEENKAEIVQEDNGKSKTYNTFSKVFSGGDYIMTLSGKMDLGDGEEETTMTMAKKGENICVDIKSESQNIAIIYKDNTTYVVSHDEKMCITMAGKQEDAFDGMELLSEEDLAEIEKETCTTGKETIDEIEYDYEKFEEEDSTEIFYFLGNELKYSKSINKDGTEDLMKIIELSSDVKDDIFAIPEEYQVIEQ